MQDHSAAGTRCGDVGTLLADLVESIDDAVISLSTHGTIEQWNASAQRLFGYTAAQTVSPSLMQAHLASLWSAEWSLSLHTSHCERVATSETLLAREDGSLRLILCRLLPMFDAPGNAIGSTLIARDVTERRCAKAQLRHLFRSYPLTALARRQAQDARLTNLMSQTFAGKEAANGRDEEVERLRLLNDSLGLAGSRGTDAQTHVR